jgi:hypothetical protein
MSLSCVCVVLASSLASFATGMPQATEPPPADQAQEEKPADELSKPVETNPTEANPDETKPAETKPAEVKPPEPKITPPASAPVELPPLRSKWDATFYGFVQAQGLIDETQSFNEQAGGTLVQRPETYAGSHKRFQTSIRNSRLGFKMSTPEFMGMKAYGMAEMDFLGNQPSDASEAALFNSPTFRVRHFNFRLDTGWFEILAGQWWQLIGWNPIFVPATGEIQGLPGQIYGRTQQLRLSKLVKGDAVGFEIAAAASRPPQRDGAAPDGQAGLRVMLNGWKGLRTAGGAGTQVDPLQIGISGAVRRFAVKEFAPVPKTEQIATGYAVSGDILLPVIPATMEERGNALTLTGSLYEGQGFTDMFSSTNGGVGVPALPAATMGGAAQAADIDAGLVAYDANHNLQTVEWHGFMAGLQYYVPPSGTFWVSLNYNQMRSNNVSELGFAGAKVRRQIQWFDANLWLDVTNSVRFNVEGSLFRDTYVDETTASNLRGQVNLFYIF